MDSGTDDGPPRRPSHEVNAFEVGDLVFLKYRCDPALFSAVGQYYDPVHHRFELPAREFDSVRSVFESHACRPVLVDDVREYCVVTRARSAGSLRGRLTELLSTHLYEPYPAENCHEFRAWRHHGEASRDVVLEREAGDRVLRVLKDRRAVERATNAGGKPVAETDVDPFGVLE